MFRPRDPSFQLGLICISLALGLVLVPSLCGQTDEEPVLALDKFIATETRSARTGDFRPDSRPSDAAAGFWRSFLETPRSVTLLTPELLRLYGVRDFADLPRVLAGGERPNFFGLAGSPVLRGDFAGTFFNGMQRAFQRNEMPMSFGSLEGMDVVKGPAPAHFGATQAGGYVNFLPKSPFYDRARSAMRVTAGSYGYFNAQLDTGGPWIWREHPAAFRLSLTAQESDSYYDNVVNNYVSAYGALKVRMSADWSVFAGAEYYRYRTNENAGWNRVTQELIDHGTYIVGEAIDATSAAAGGRVLPSAIPFVSVPAGTGASPFSFGAVPALIPPPEFVAGLTSAQRALLGPQGEYTAAYLNAGGPVATAQLEGHQVLADPNDHADAENWLGFCDLVGHLTADTTIKNQTLVERLTSDKLSSYGYAFRMKQTVLQNKTTVERKGHDWLETLLYGIDLRYSSALQLQDFSSEPFGRRDLSRPDITANSMVLAGPLRPLTGDTRALWSQGADSALWQAGLFAVGQARLHRQFGVLGSLRLEGAQFRAWVPREFERHATPGARFADGGKNYYTASVSPLWQVTPEFSLYAALQQGTALNPTQGGNVTSEANFGQTQLAELGAKISLFNGKLQASLAGYWTELSRFNNITNNPYGLRTKGIEWEATWTPVTKFFVRGTAGLRRTVQTNTPGFRFQATQEYYMPLVAGGLYAGGAANAALLAANNPDRVFPGSPEFTANLYAGREWPGGWGISAGPGYRASYWHNYEHTLRIPSSVVWNGTLSYRRGEWDLLLEVSNIFSADWFYGSEPTFAPNALITKAPPIQAKLSVTRRF